MLNDVFSFLLFLPLNLFDHLSFLLTIKVRTECYLSVIQLINIDEVIVSRVLARSLGFTYHVSISLYVPCGGWQASPSVGPLQLLHLNSFDELIGGAELAGGRAPAIF